MKALLGWLLVGAAVGLALWGCEKDKVNCSDCDWDWGLSHTPSIAVASEVLCFDAIDTVSTEFTARVSDGDGNPQANSPVQIGIESGTGRVQIVSPTGSRTDSNGEVRARFIASEVGPVEISALSETNRVAISLIRVLDCSPNPPHYQFAVATDRLRIPSYPMFQYDSIQVTLSVQSADGVPLVGFRLPIIYRSGLIKVVPPTGASGETSFWWHFNQNNYGRHYLTGCEQNYRDTVWVTVVNR